MSQAASGRASLPRTVRIGGVAKAALLWALGEHRVHLNEAAGVLFEDARFIPGSASRVIEIVARSVADLGFPEGATYAQLTARAAAEGLVECPLELGPHLRLQFLDQAGGVAGSAMTHGRAPAGSITIASPPLDESDETPKGFYLRRVDGVLWLRGYWSWPGHVWSPDDVLVFGRGNDAG